MPRSTREVLMQRCKAVENPAIVPQMSKKMPQNIPGTPQILQVMSYPIDWCRCFAMLQMKPGMRRKEFNWLQSLFCTARFCSFQDLNHSAPQCTVPSLCAAGTAHNSGICWRSSWRLATTSMAIQVQSRTVFLQSGRLAMSTVVYTCLYMSIRDYTFIGI